MSKFEKLLDLLVNEHKDEAEKLFHEIVVEKSRSIYEGILEDEEAETTEESADKDDADEVDEAMHKDKKEKKKMKEESEEDAEEEVEETEEPAESADETIEEIGGDATDDLLSDIEAEGEGMDHMDMPDEEGDDEGEEGEEEEEAEEMFEPLEKELDQLKAEFAKMMDSDDDKPEESLEVEESKDADSIVKEYAEMVKSGHGAEKMGKEAGADQKKSPVAGKNKPVNDAKAHSMGGGAEEKGGVGKALTGDTAKPMGKTYKNAGGSKSQKLDMAPKAETSEGSADAKSPVASK
jgi:hypothetical protein